MDFSRTTASALKGSRSRSNSSTTSFDSRTSSSLICSSKSLSSLMGMNSFQNEEEADNKEIRIERKTQNLDFSSHDLDKELDNNYSSCVKTRRSGEGELGPAEPESQFDDDSSVTSLELEFLSKEVAKTSKVLIREISDMDFEIDFDLSSILTHIYLNKIEDLDQLKDAFQVESDDCSIGRFAAFRLFARKFKFLQ